MTERLPFHFENFGERDMTIHVSDNALMHLVLAGIESFHVRPWGKTVSENRGAVETAGLLLGYFRSKNTIDHVFVSDVSTDTYAYRDKNSVLINETVTAEKLKVIESRWPYMSLVGDFHTHPYSDVAETASVARNQQYWRFSEWDYKCYEEAPTDDQFHPSKWKGRISLVLTIASNKRKHIDVQGELIPSHNNAITWLFEDYRLFLAGYAIDISTKSESEHVFVVSPPQNTKKNQNQRPNIYLDVPSVLGTDLWQSYSGHE